MKVKVRSRIKNSKIERILNTWYKPKKCKIKKTNIREAFLCVWFLILESTRPWGLVIPGVRCSSSVFPLYSLVLYVGWGWDPSVICCQHQGWIHLWSFPSLPTGCHCWPQLSLWPVYWAGSYILQRPPACTPKDCKCPSCGAWLECFREWEANRALSFALDRDTQGNWALCLLLFLNLA
jgi:hypothetical protein